MRQVALALALCGSWMGCSQTTPSSPKSGVVLERATVAAPPPAGSWQTLTMTWPVDADMMLMTDGRLLGMSQSKSCYVLAPASDGTYGGSSWTAVASMHDSRLYFGSKILPDGRVFVVGGEYGSGTGKGEVYDPVADSWGSQFTAGGAADTETALLPDGKIYIAWTSQIYDPATNMVGSGPSFPNAHYDEAAFTLLPDQSFLTIPMDETTAYRYIPAQNKFVQAGTVQNLYDTGSEIGPSLRLASGKVLWLGANGKSAIWTPPASASDPGSWVNGPDIPSGLMADDAPAAMLPNGHVLFVADQGLYKGPAAVFEYDPGTNMIAASAGAPAPGVAYTTRMVVLPTGQVLLTDGSTGYLYTPGVSPDASWKPTITTVVPKGNGVYELTGTQLHGFNEGAAYGDDAEMSSNFPLVRFESGGGSTVTYARTFGWAPAVVGLGPTPRKTQLKLPALADGSYNLVAVANGIASDPTPVTVAGGNLIINDFKLNKPATIVVPQGGSAMATLTTTKTQGGAEMLPLTVTNQPTGVTVTLNPTMVSSDNGSTMVTVTASPSAALGAATFTVQAVGATVTHALDVDIDVQMAPDMSQLPDLATPPDLAEPDDLSASEDMAGAGGTGGSGGGGSGGTGGNGGGTGGNGGGGGGGSGCSFVAGSTAANASAAWLVPVALLGFAFRRRRAC